MSANSIPRTFLLITCEPIKLFTRCRANAKICNPGPRHVGTRGVLIRYSQVADVGITTTHYYLACVTKYPNGTFRSWRRLSSISDMAA